jgi:hypothetical protein
VYAKHCFPDPNQIVKRVREVVRDYEAFTLERAEREKEEKKGLGRESDGGEDGSDGVEDGHGEHQRRAPGKLVGRDSLKKIYIMTNGNPAWLAEVKQALMEDAASGSAQGQDDKFEWVWEGISTSRDLQLGWEEKPVAQALDMSVAQRAELFVGNGFSSLTSNIVMLRMKMGFDPVQTRFW